MQGGGVLRGFAAAAEPAAGNVAVGHLGRAGAGGRGRVLVGAHACGEGAQRCPAPAGQLAMSPHHTCPLQCMQRVSSGLMHMSITLRADVALALQGHS